MAWGPPLTVEPLSTDGARAVFLASAPEFASDPDLANLLEPLEGVPLAVELLASAAEGEPNLRALRQRWANERTEVLRRGLGDQRLLSLDVSLQVSISGPRMTNEARRVLSLLGVLPDGIAHGDLDILLPSAGRRGASQLRKVALADDTAQRVRTLSPIREHVRRHLAPTPVDLEAAVDHYARLAKTRGPKVGTAGGGAAVTRLLADSANIEAMILLGLKNEARSAVEGAVAFSEFIRFTGVGSDRALSGARLVARELADPHLEAAVLISLGDIALARSDHDAARTAFEQARPLYEQIRAVPGQANCVFRLGVIALARSDHDAARTAFEQARPLYERVGDVPGQANCISGLGDIALARSDHDVARFAYEQARPLYEQVGDVLGQANCITGLGEIALARSDHDAARTAFDRAQTLYEQVGDVRGQANCIFRLGDIALARSDHDAARTAFEQALHLYGKIPEPYSVGQAHRGLARQSSGLERAQHVEAARAAWRRIRREDLVTELEQEFGS